MDLDTKDKKLLAVLQKDSRETLSSIAKKIHLSRESVNYRINRLLKKGIVREFVSIVDFPRVGYSSFAVYLKLKDISQEEEKQVIYSLRQDDNIIWIASVGGKYDLVIEVLTKSIQKFNEFYDEFLSNHHQYIASSEIIIRTIQEDLTRKYIYQEENLSINIKQSQQEKLDLKDKEILLLLSNNARISNIDISKKINLPQTTVSYKIKNLKSRGVIKQFTTFLEPKLLGYQSFKTLIYLRDFSLEQTKALFQYARQNPNIYYFVKCIGKWNIEMEIEVRTLEEYQQELLNLRNKFGSIIQDMEFITIFNEHKETYFTKAML